MNDNATPAQARLTDELGAASVLGLSACDSIADHRRALGLAVG